MSPRAPRSRCVLRSIAPLAPALALLACAGPRDFDNENDRLRRELFEARAEIDRLAASEQRLASALEAESAAGARSAPSEQALALLPRAEKITIGRLSGPNASRTAVDLFIAPLDDRARFVQVAGRLTVRLDLIPPPETGASAEPRLLTTLTLDPAELREAYRSNLTGTHYSVRVPLDPTITPGDGALSATVRLDDLVTGARLEASARWAVPAPPR